MNAHKLFNGLIIFTLLLPALLTGSPEPARAAPIQPYTLNRAEATDLDTLLSAVSASAIQSPTADAENIEFVGHIGGVT